MKSKVHTVYYRSFGGNEAGFHLSSEYTTLLRVYEDLDEACEYVNKSNEQLKKKLLHRSNRQYVIEGTFIKNKNRWNGFGVTSGGAEVILGKEVDLSRKKS